MTALSATTAAAPLSRLIGTDAEFCLQRFARRRAAMVAERFAANEFYLERAEALRD
jgi:hypothetical protein